jgi:hypothetical protein
MLGDVGAASTVVVVRIWKQVSVSNAMAIKWFGAHLQGKDAVTGRYG